MKMKLATLALLATTQIAIAEPTDTAIAVAVTAGVSTQINQPTALHSVHGVTIYNTTPGFKDFSWTISLCPDTQPEHCLVKKDHLGLATGQHWGKTYYLDTVVVFHAVGTKPFTAKTEITGGAYAIASDTKYAEVHY